jgi:flagellar FliJ protein
MQRFYFKLQKLLDYRKIREEQAQAEFAKATRVFLLEKEKMKQMETTLVETFDLLKAEQAKASSLLMLKMFQEYIDRTREGIRLQAVKVAAAADRRQSCLRLFEEASRKRKVVDNLREKKLEQYQAEVLHEEQAFLDDLAGQRYIRNN